MQGAALESDVFIGMLFEPTSTDNLLFPILSNTGDTISVLGDCTALATNGSVCAVIDPHPAADSIYVDAGKQPTSADLAGMVYGLTDDLNGWSRPVCIDTGTVSCFDMGAYEVQ